MSARQDSLAAGEVALAVRPRAGVNRSYSRFVALAKRILPGVAVTFITSIAFGEAFGAYLSEYLRNYISTYAGLASVMIALVYLYWVALLFVFGGELNASIIRARQQWAADKAKPADEEAKQGPAEPAARREADL